MAAGVLARVGGFRAGHAVAPWGNLTPYAGNRLLLLFLLLFWLPHFALSLSLSLYIYIYIYATLVLTPTLCALSLSLLTRAAFLRVACHRVQTSVVVVVVVVVEGGSQCGALGELDPLRS